MQAFRDLLGQKSTLRIYLRAAVCAIVPLATACSNMKGASTGSDNAKQISASATIFQPMEVSVGYGVGCKSFAYPDVVGPPSFRVHDVGKHGVPKLGNRQVQLVRRIKAHVHSSTLRFVFLGRVPELIIFDAYAGPCANFAPGYRVLNSNFSEYYEPGQNAFGVHAGFIGGPTPGPWMKSPRP